MGEEKTLDSLLQNCPKNEIIGNNLIKAWKIINDPKYKKIVCSISGGSDSDVMLDIVWKCDKDNKVDYVWFDTGLEYQATKDHLKYLEKKYGIKIIPYKAIKPIPLSCREYGQPFLSKQVSEFIKRLQQHNFKWEDRPFEELYKEYPNCKSALEWWCSVKGEGSKFNIGQNKWLKEFMIQNPPDFDISNVCCDYAKKKVSHKLITEYKTGEQSDVEDTHIKIVLTIMILNVITIDLYFGIKTLIKKIITNLLVLNLVNAIQNMV